MVSMNDVLHAACAFTLLLQLPGLEAGCPEAPRGRTEVFEESCYEFIRDKHFQPAASKLCLQYGGHLVHIHNKETQDWLEEQLREQSWLQTDSDNAGVWLGLEELSHWTWTLNNSGKGDRKLEFYTNWEKNEPDPTATNRKCAVFGDVTNFQWRASLCNDFVRYYAICQYDESGIFSAPENVVGLCIGIAAVLLIIGAGLSLLYCHRRRKALLERLHSNLESPTAIKKLNIPNLDPEVGSSCDNVPPPYYGDADSNEDITPNIGYNLNIPPTSAAYEQPKVRDKDLSLTDVRRSCNLQCPSNKPQYSRSVSAPAPAAVHAIPYFSSMASAPPMEALGEDDGMDEASPLRYAGLGGSNDLS